MGKKNTSHFDTANELVVRLERQYEQDSRPVDQKTDLLAKLEDARVRRNIAKTMLP